MAYHYASKSAAPLALRFLAFIVFICMLLPVFYLIIRGIEVDDMAKITAIIFRWRNLQLLINTLLLTLNVLILTTFIALPLAWLLARSDIKAKKALLILAVLPLSVPGYVMAFSLIGLGGYYGFMNEILGIRFTRPEGLSGASLALGLYTYPYLFLPLYNAFKSQDASLENSARSLGYSPWQSFWRIVLPNISPALFSGWLIISLYSLGDFGAVSLMRLDVFSSVIYDQYTSGFESNYAAWLALMLLLLTGSVIILFKFLPQFTRLEKTGIGSGMQKQNYRLGKWSFLAWVFVIFVALLSLGLPLSVIIFWLSRSALDAIDFYALAQVAGDTLYLALPTAIVVSVIALLMAIKILWWPNRFTPWQERSIYFAYAIPSLPLALSIAFFSLWMLPFWYQSFPVLIIAYCISFLALAYGSVKNGLIQTGQRLHQTSLSLGVGPIRSLIKVTLPAIRPQIISGATLVFLLVVKELPITYLLAPLGVSTISIEIFTRTNEGQMIEAAPYALFLILFSSLFIGFVLRNKTNGHYHD